MDISLEKLEALLQEQKEITANHLLHNSYYYNQENTESTSKSLPIDKEKFLDIAMRSKLPNDIIILKKYDVK